MDKGGRVVELRPNPTLLDPNFEGYKLSLEPVPIYRKSLVPGVRVCPPDDNHFSFSHMKMFSLHNHLHVNTHKPNNIYFIDEHYKVHKVMFSPPSHQILLEEVFQFKTLFIDQKGNYNVSLFFPSPEMVLLCNGSGVVYLIDIKDIQGKEVWQMMQTDCLFKEDTACLLLDGRIEFVDDGTCLLHVLTSQIEEKSEENKQDTKSGLFQTALMWRTLRKINCHSWQEKCFRKLSVNGSIDHVALGLRCKSLNIVCDGTPKWVFDSEKELPQEIEDKAQEMESTPEKIYTWMQTDQEITVWFSLPENLTKNDVKVKIDDLKIEINLRNEQLIDGNFHQRIDGSLSLWSFEKNKLEIQLVKNEPGLMWPALLVNDYRGSEVINPDMAAAVHEKLAHLCSDKEEDNLPPFNSQQMEECDVACQSMFLLRLDAECHKITHEVSLSSTQWLFKVHCEPDKLAALCFRHDIDACVWQFKDLEEGDTTWEHQHLGTFSAFGYVQASKTQKKFLTCPPSLSYAVICESSHHVYIYRQPSSLSSELKNRHTGKKVKTISKQQLINLETNEEILGVYATDNILYLLLDKSLSILVINS